VGSRRLIDGQLPEAMRQLRTGEFGDEYAPTEVDLRRARRELATDASSREPRGNELDQAAEPLTAQARLATVPQDHSPAAGRVVRQADRVAGGLVRVVL
jgi:hypothetical protein